MTRKSIRFKKFLAKKRRFQPVKKVRRVRVALTEEDKAVMDLRRRTQFPELDNAVFDTQRSAGSVFANLNNEASAFDEAVDDAIPKGGL